MRRWKTTALSKQHGCLLITLFLFLQRMCKGIGNFTPWLILAGSGGVADILVTLMNRGCWDADSVHELLLDTFPNAHHSTDISNWVKLVRAMHTAGRQTLTKICTCQVLNTGIKVGHTGKHSETNYCVNFIFILRNLCKIA